MRDTLAKRGFIATTSRLRSDAADAVVFDLARLNSEPWQAERLLGNEDFAAVYCVGAMTDVEACEADPTLAFAINRDGPTILARSSARLGLPFVYVSSDYVFDGEAGPYDERATPNPISAYGRSKLEGERAVLDANPLTLVVRTTVVYGPDPGRKNFLYTMLRVLQRGGVLRTPEDQLSTPTYNRDLATALVALVDARASGTFHVAGPETMSRTEFALRAAEALKLDAAGILPVLTSELGQRAPRPRQGGLSTLKFRTRFPEIIMRDIENAIGDWQPFREAD